MSHIGEYKETCWKIPQILGVHPGNRRWLATHRHQFDWVSFPTVSCLFPMFIAYINNSWDAHLR